MQRTSIRCLGVLVAILISAGPSPAAQQVPFYDPPLGLKQSAADQGAAFEAAASEAGISLQVSLSPFLKRIELLWENTNQGTYAHKQYLPVGYSPTEVTAGSVFGEIFVGGTNKFGYTKIVRYLFDTPKLDGNQVPLDAAMLEQDEVFGANKQSGTRDIYQLLPNRGAPGHLFVQFWNTKDVYDLDLSTGEATRVVTVAPPASGLILVPELGQPHGFTYSRDHIDHGFVYFFTSINPAEGGSSTVILRDSNRDGALEDGMTTTLEQYESLGFADPSRYIQ